MSNKIDFSEYRFLVIDDEAFIKGLVVRMLKDCHVENVLTANDGAHAVRVLSSEPSPVDIILCDINMKPVNGLQLLRGIRTGKIPHIPHDQKFILLTGHGDKDLVKTAIEYDVHGYLVKPVAQEKLVEGIKKALTQEHVIKPPGEYPAYEPKEGAKASKPKAPPVGKTVWKRVDQKQKDEWLKNKLAEIKAESTAKSEQGPQFRNVEHCKLMKLETGMVIAEDIVDDEDMVLITAGTTLSERLIAKLQELADQGAPEDVKIGELVSV